MTRMFGLLGGLFERQTFHKAFNLLSFFDAILLYDVSDFGGIFDDFIQKTGRRKNQIFNVSIGIHCDNLMFIQCLDLRD